MTILGIETATEVCAVALWRSGQLLGEIRYRRKRVHAELLPAMIEHLLQETQSAFSELDGVAVSIGPGSFTGLRIGLAMAKGIAFSRRLAIVGIQTPDAIASHIVPPAVRLTVVLPSRRGEVYAAPYRNLDGAYHREGKIVALKIEDFAHWAADTTYVAGPGAAALQKAGISAFRYVPENYWEISAAPVARLGARRLIAGDSDPVSALEPEYIKPFFTTSVAG